MKAIDALRDLQKDIRQAWKVLEPLEKVGVVTIISLFVLLIAGILYMTVNFF